MPNSQLIIIQRDRVRHFRIKLKEQSWMKLDCLANVWQTTAQEHCNQGLTEHRALGCHLHTYVQLFFYSGKQGQEEMVATQISQDGIPR